MKSISGELATLATVLAVPMAICLVFPYEALHFKASSGRSEAGPSLAIVQLSSAEERKAIRVARMSLRGDDESVRRLHADIYLEELPEDPVSSVLSVEERHLAAPPPVVECGLMPFLPSQAAPPPARIAPGEASGADLAFPRQEMLRLN